MNLDPHAKDIFLWADGYWCFREDFQIQPRHTYGYLLVLTDSDQWRALTGAIASTRPVSRPFSTSRASR